MSPASFIACSIKGPRVSMGMTSLLPLSMSALLLLVTLHSPQSVPALAPSKSSWEVQALGFLSSALIRRGVALLLLAPAICGRSGWKINFSHWVQCSPPQTGRLSLLSSECRFLRLGRWWHIRTLIKMCYIWETRVLMQYLSVWWYFQSDPWCRYSYSGRVAMKLNVFH